MVVDARAAAIGVYNTAWTTEIVIVPLHTTFLSILPYTHDTVALTELSGVRHRRHSPCLGLCSSRCDRIIRCGVVFRSWCFSLSSPRRLPLFETLILKD